MKYFTNSLWLQIIIGFILNIIVVSYLLYKVFDPGISLELIPVFVIYSLIGNTSWGLFIIMGLSEDKDEFYLGRGLVFFMYVVSLFFLFNIINTPPSEIYQGEGIFEGGGHYLILMLMNLIQIIPIFLPAFFSFFKFILKLFAKFYRV